MSLFRSSGSGFSFGVLTTTTTTTTTVSTNTTASASSAATTSASVFGATGASGDKGVAPLFSLPERKDRENRDSAKVSNGLRFGNAVSSSNPKMEDIFAFGDPLLEIPWRRVEWTEERKASLMKSISTYRPAHTDVAHARVLLLGPIGAGKSSFISSVQSVFGGRVTNRAMVGPSTTGFTKKSFNIRGQKGEDTGLVLCDIMGLTDGGMTGLTLGDILSVIKGHVAEGHKFSANQPVTADSDSYVKCPGLKDMIHCVAFVVDASSVLTESKGFGKTFQQLREHISDLGVHQVALLTHVDKICPHTHKDLTQVYNCCRIQERMHKAAALLGMSTSYIVPVKNYDAELDTDVNTDVLLLSAVDHILQYADLYFKDNTSRDDDDLFRDSERV